VITLSQISIDQSNECVKWYSFKFVMDGFNDTKS
jgi:hypothetical protein